MAPWSLWRTGSQVLYFQTLNHLMRQAPLYPPAATGENFLGAAAFLTQAELQSSPQGVVVVRQEPTSKLTLWLPGEVQGDLISQFGLPGQDGHSLQEVSTINGNSLTLPINEITHLVSDKGDSSQWDMKLLTLVDGWQIPQENEIVANEFQRKSRYGRSGNSDKATRSNLSLPSEMNVSHRLVNEAKLTVPDATAEEIQMKWLPADLAKSSDTQMDAAMEPNEDHPIIRTKLEFSKGADGSKKLSYEEEVQQQERRHEKDDLKRKFGLKGLRLTFLDLLRY